MKRYNKIYDIKGIPSSVNCLSFSPGGKLLAVGLDDGLVSVYSHPEATPLYHAAGQSPVTAISWLRGGRNHQLFIGYSDGQMVILTLDITRPVSSSSFTPFPQTVI